MNLSESELLELLGRLDMREARLRGDVVTSEQLDVAGAAASYAAVKDSGERGEHYSRADVRGTEGERDIAELREIAAAKDRMARGVFGECIDCGADILFARLQAQPTAARCLACQERLERRLPAVPRGSLSP